MPGKWLRRDLSQHYKSKTDWDIVKRMKAAMGMAAREKLLQEADPHTRFIIEKHYAENRLPTYTSHVMVNEVTVEVSNAGPKQLKMDGFQLCMLNIPQLREK